MRLLNVHTLTVERINLCWDTLSQTYKPRYAILSHMWLDGEVTFDDLDGGNGFPDAARAKAGWDKIQKSATQALADGYDYVWVDTCCIDKSSSAELSEAINSMFQWYRHAAVCYAFLSDVVPPHRETARELFGRSRYFTRGWTLQELVAPGLVNFYDVGWNFLGTKEDLVDAVAEVTRIPALALVEPASLSQFTVAQRMSWAARRVTTREEDQSYCLLGIFDINLPLLYGEGGERAFLRLQEEIIRRYDDDSVFAWRVDEDGHGHPLRGSGRGGLLATGPACFEGCENILTLPDDPFTDFLRGLRLQLSPVAVTNRGWKVHRLVWQEGYWLMMPLRCWDVKRQPGPGQSLISITLTEHDSSAQAGLAQFARLDWMTVSVADLLEKRRYDERELYLLPSSRRANQADVAGLSWLVSSSRDVWIRSLPEGFVMHGFETSSPDKVTVSDKTRLCKGLEEGQWVAFTLRCPTGPLPTPTGDTPASVVRPRDIYVSLFVFSRSMSERPLHALGSAPDPAGALREGHAQLVAAASGAQNQASCDGPGNTMLQALIDMGDKMTGTNGKRHVIDVFAMGNNKGAKVWDASPDIEQHQQHQQQQQQEDPPPPTMRSMSVSGSLLAPDDRGSNSGLSVRAPSRVRERSRLGRVGTGFGSGFGFDNGRMPRSRMSSFEDLRAQSPSAQGGGPPQMVQPRDRIGSNSSSRLWQRRRRRNSSVSISPSRVVVVVDHDEEEEAANGSGNDSDPDEDDKGLGSDDDPDDDDGDDYDDGLIGTSPPESPRSQLR